MIGNVNSKIINNYKYHYNQDETFQDQITIQKQKSKEQQKLFIDNSEFTNLNYGIAERSLSIIKEPQTISKGLVISLNSYEGKIEVFNNLFNKNLVFFPSAAFSNAPRFEDKVFNPLPYHWFRKGIGSELEN